MYLSCMETVISRRKGRWWQVASQNVALQPEKIWKNAWKTKKTTCQPTATDEPTEIKLSWIDCNKLPKLRWSLLWPRHSQGTRLNEASQRFLSGFLSQWQYRRSKWAHMWANLLGTHIYSQCLTHVGWQDGFARIMWPKHVQNRRKTLNRICQLPLQLQQTF